MRQTPENSVAFLPPSLSDLLSQLVSDPTFMPIEVGGEVELHDPSAAQVVDPRLAWEEALTGLQGTGEKLAAKLRPPAEWNGLVASQEPALDLAFCAGNFPQMVRNLGLLLQAEAQGETQPLSRPFQGAALAQWAESAMSKPFPQPLLAIGVLRLARDFEGAERLIRAGAASVPAEWKSAWVNEEAALAWHSGRREQARQLWEKSDPRHVPSLFNRGMSALFLGRPGEALAPLRQVVAQLPESSSWHHLARLYLTLAEMRD